MPQLVIQQPQLTLAIAQHAGVRLQKPFLPLDVFLDRLQIRAQQKTAGVEQLLLVQYLLLNQRV